MQQAKRIAINTGFLYARMAITMFVSLYSTRLILDALGVSDYGVFNLVGGAIAMLTFLNTAMATSSQRFMSYAQGEGRLDKQINIFNVSVVLHLAVGLIIVVILETAGLLMFDKVLKIDPDRMYAAKAVYHFMVASTFFTIISVPYDAVINARENMLFVALLGIAEAFFKFGIALFISHTSYDRLITYGLCMASMFVVLLVIRRVYCHMNYDEVSINFKKHFNRPLFKEMTGFAGWSFLGSASSMLTHYGQGVVLNMFFGTTVNAAQGVSNQISGQLGSFSGNMLKALNPFIVKKEGSGQRDKMMRATFTGSKMAFFLLAFFSIPVMVEMPLIFEFWLRDVPEYTIVFCRLLLIRNLIENLFLPVSTAIRATGRIKNFQIGDSIISILPLPISIIFFWLGYEPWVLYIIFIALVMVRTFGVTLYQAKVQCELSVRRFLLDVIFRCIIVSLLCASINFIPYHFLEPNLFRVFLVILSSFFAGTILIYTLGLDSYERQLIRTGFGSIYDKLMGNLNSNAKT